MSTKTRYESAVTPCLKCGKDRQGRLRHHICAQCSICHGCGSMTQRPSNSRWCEACHRSRRNAQAQRWRDVRLTPEIKRKHALKHSYNITPEQYESMLVTQGGCCAVCGDAPGRRRLHVDHDHNTGRVRALLCVNCNTSLGKLQESAERIEALLRYVKEVC